MKRISERKLQRIIQESISNVIGQKKYFYHAIRDLHDLPYILKNGLIPKNWDGIFLCDTKKYNSRNTALLGIEKNERNIEKYNISSFTGVSYACKPIHPSDIELIDCRIGEGENADILMASAWLRENVLDCPIEQIEELCSVWSIKVLYEDVCNYFFGVKNTNKLKKLNVVFKKLGI